MTISLPLGRILDGLVFTINKTNEEAGKQTNSILWTSKHFFSTDLPGWAFDGSGP